MIPIADAFHHAHSSVKKWGGLVSEYIDLHRWFDETKEHFSDPRHRAIRHHSQGIGWLQDTFGMAIEVSITKQGYCEFCTEENVQLVARLVADPDQLICNECHADDRIPSESLGTKSIPTRWIGEQHVLEDFGYIPTMADFLRCMTTEKWMIRGARKLSIELGKDDSPRAA